MDRPVKTAPGWGAFRSRWRIPLFIGTLFALLSSLGVIGKTLLDLQPLPKTLGVSHTDVLKPQFLDRHGLPLSATYRNFWNVTDQVPLHEVPDLLRKAFVASEDRRFFNHGGVDWVARIHALVQNLRALKAVRGASTLTEQVVRMLHPRRRTVWSRWLEGFEAMQLEARFSKSDILEFYLNQVPFAHNRRGVRQAARMYFNRGLDTLDVHEMLALAVLVRAPSVMDLRRLTGRAEKAVAQLAERMLRYGWLTESDTQRATQGFLVLAQYHLPVEAGHFVQYLVKHLERIGANEADVHLESVSSTLDAGLQDHVQKILDTRLRELANQDVTDGAVLVLDHVADEVLAWVNGGGLDSGRPGSWIDAILAPRQPGSTLKPFLYALAIENGWSPATLIDDSPLAESIHSGIHRFQNFSRVHYGPLRLREALGNSLNVPAIRTIRFVGKERFLERLRTLGFASLDRSSDHYGEGLALGNGEVRLLELVQGYAALARLGLWRPLRTVNRMSHPDLAAAEERQAVSMHPGGSAEPVVGGRPVISEEAASLVGHILADPQARSREFGVGGVLQLPVPTAVKTGTSNDHRDIWALGYSDRHTVGVWMGNLNRNPTRGLTGSTGPAMVLRAVFAELNRHRSAEPIRSSPRLQPKYICATTGLAAGPRCPTSQEWFVPGTEPFSTCHLHDTHSRRASITAPSADPRRQPLQLAQPTPGLQLAMDPHVPDELEAFALRLPPSIRADRIEWMVDDSVVGITRWHNNQCAWPLARGHHTARARIWLPHLPFPRLTPPVAFHVR